MNNDYNIIQKKIKKRKIPTLKTIMDHIKNVQTGNISSNDTI